MRLARSYERRCFEALRVASAACAILAVAWPGSSAAQRVEENATAQAEDAFGINVSGQNLGLYDPTDVRGFSPTAAGNIRLDGLYIDQEGGFTSRFVNGYRILVGPSVLGHPFPAPSGIADYGVRRPGPTDLLSVAAQVDTFGGRQIEFDGQAHDLLPNLGITGGLGLYRYEFGRGDSNRVLSMALTGVWKPASGVEVIPFYSRIDTRDSQSQPIVLLAGDAPSPAVTTTRFLGQRWAGTDETAANYGVLIRAGTGPWQLRAGVFRSEDDSPISYTPLFVDALPDGTASRVVIAERGAFAGATSGEIQGSRTFEDGPRKHRVYVAAWGRDQQRRYGSTDTATLSPGPIEEERPAPIPSFSFGAQTRDLVRQWTAGIAYEGAWKGVGTLNVGLQKTDYRKSVIAPGAILPTSTAAPWLYNIAGSLKVTGRLTFYAGVSHGLEESNVAPEIAVNRNQAPPAIRTDQLDGGLRWTISTHMSLVADVFRIEKPYYGLDQSRVFRDLGTVSHRGIELSLAGSPVSGLSVVTGGILLDASLAGDEVASGVVGRRPVGYTPLTLIASFDYRFPSFQALSFDANVQQTGHRIATVDDVLRLPAQALIGVGARYRLKIAGKPAVVRLQSSDVTDAYSWSIAGSGALQPNPPRQVTLRVTVDV